MKARLTLILLMLPALTHVMAQDTYNQIDEMGNITERSENRNFNKHNNDTTQHKEIPKGLYVWTVDRRFGDVIPATPDTVPHLFMNSTFNSGMYGEYNSTGSNYTPRLSRIFINRHDTENFVFTQPYSFALKRPEDFLFINTLSPFTNILYDNCGDKTNGEDHIDAKFAVNANKRLSFGFDLDYEYARGYFSNQNISHFNSTLFSSYIGDRYQMHALFTTSHQKAAENGGITNDEYITHPESFQDSYSENEIPTILSQNWNRNDHQHLFLSHRYNIGFYRKVKMTDEELKARLFAMESKQEKELKMADRGEDKNRKGGTKQEKRHSGRPDGARIMGAEPKVDSIAVAVDSTRIKVEGQAAIDSLNRLQAMQDSIDATMKREYVPVTSFIHTLEWHNYRHIYQAYDTPTDYYLNRYYERGIRYGNDSIYDQTKHMQAKNTFALALLEGFNKYVKAGLKGFITYDYCSYQLPDTVNGIISQSKWTEGDLSIGAQLSKTQGKTLHFNAGLEAWIAGPNAKQLTLDFSTDLNFPLFGDTVQLAANAYFHKIYPAFFQAKYHSKHLWWDKEDDLSAEKRTHLEGVFSYPKTNTKLRVAIDEIKDYTYYGMSYDATKDKRTNMTAGIYQESDHINLITAQLHQDFHIGPVHWENIITYQDCNKSEVLPLPTWNIFSNLYLKFKIAKVLGVELGADATYFSKYFAPDFCPTINQFAIQQNKNSRVELGGYPFVDVYANMVLKGVRFFVMMSHVNNGSGNHMKFLTPHYPTNGSVLHFGVSWNFYN
ncbi:putative porin [Prevotella sp. lc2012]|uniref:putative porin n=1 Tax=Prevotella sp. lc2012 TaxID=1761886 RepID=UPI000899A242|nr:putative porin [Prevotella sp. lc2012]SEE10686.1 Putative porin [Prevotella sp. lc2012]